MAKHIDIGLRGEYLAEDYLIGKGWRIVDRRWRDRAKGGSATDVDIIATDRDGIYHFVEVKTRTNRANNICPTGDFSPAAAVTPAKVQRMAEAAERYLASQGLDVEIFLDLVTVVIGGGGAIEPIIYYYPDISR